MNHRQDGGLVLNQGSFQLIEGKPLTPGLLNGFHLSAVAAGHVSQSQAEVSLDRHENGVSRFDGVGQGCLHGSTAGAAHRKCEAVVGLPGVTQQLLDLTHQLHVERIKVTNRRSRQSLQNRWMSI